MIYQIKAAIFIELILCAAILLFRNCLSDRDRNGVTVGDVLPTMIIPLVGLFGHDKSIFYGFLFIVPLLWIGSPERLPKRYILTLISFPQLAQDYSVAGIYLGVWSAMLTFNAGALIALTVVRRRGLKRVMSIDVAIWLIFFCAFLMVGRGKNPNDVVRVAITTFFLVVPPYLVASRLIRSQKTAADVTMFLVLGGVCNACIAIFESIKHWSLYETLASALAVRTTFATTNLAMRAGFLRATGALLSYEAFGCVCGLSILAVITLRRRFSSMGFATIVLVLTLGLLASQARSAWVGTAVGLLLQAVYDRRWRRAGAFLAVAGVAGALATMVSSRAGRLGEIIGTNGHGGSTGEYRQRLLARGIEEARLHPWTGQTLDQLQVSMNDLRQGEHIIDFVNTHLDVLLVGGVGALSVWLLAWAIPLALGWRHRTADRRHVDPAFTSLPFAMISVLLLYLAFTSPTDREFPLLAVGMGLMAVGLRLPAQAANVAGQRRPTPRLAPAPVLRPAGAGAVPSA